MRFFSRSPSADSYSQTSPQTSPPRSRNRSRSQSIANSVPTLNSSRGKRLQRSRSQSITQPVPLPPSPTRSRPRTRSTSTAQIPASPPRPGFSLSKNGSSASKISSSPPTTLTKGPTSKGLEKNAGPLSKTVVKPLEEFIIGTTTKDRPSLASTNASYSTSATFKSAVTTLLTPTAHTTRSIIIEKDEGNSTYFEKNEDETTDGPDQEKMQAFLEKFDPGTPRMTSIGDREWMKRMYANNLLWCAAKLQRHAWVEGSEGKLFKELCKEEDRRELIHEDLMRYTAAMKAYEEWEKSTIRIPEADIHTYGRTLAILECASKHAPSNPLMAHISSALSQSLSSWSTSQISSEETTNSKVASDIFKQEKVKLEKVGIVQRMQRIEMASIGGFVLLVPILLVVLHPIITTVLCTFVTGGLLALWIFDISEKALVSVTNGYSAVMKSLWVVDKYDYLRVESERKKKV